MKRLVMALALPACQSSTAPHVGAGDPVPAPANNPNILLQTKDLQKSLGFDRVIESDDDGLLTVTVPVRNLSDHHYYLDYKFAFYDKAGREVKPMMGWKEIVIPPRTQSQMSVNAMDEQAKRWRLEIKWANK